MNRPAAPDIPWLLFFPDLAGVQDHAGIAALQAATTHRFTVGTRIVHAGDPCQSFILLAQGTLRVYEVGASGREIVLYRVRTGELCVLTLSNLLAATAYSAGAMAEEDVEVVMIPMPQFQEALAKSDAFRSFVISTLSRRMGEVMALVEQVAFRRLDLRLACLLGQLFGENLGDPVEVTHQALALELGSTREVVSRMLKEFERMGCIRLRRGMIELLSPETLARLTCATTL
jgi:CRP/FNR family transcriptional regulator